MPRRQAITLLENIIPYFPYNLLFTNRGDYDETQPLTIGQKVLCVCVCIEFKVLTL